MFIYIRSKIHPVIFNSKYVHYQVLKIEKRYRDFVELHYE